MFCQDWKSILSIGVPPLEKLPAWSLKETDIYQMGKYNKNIFLLTLWEMCDLMFSDCD